MKQTDNFSLSDLMIRHQNFKHSIILQHFHFSIRFHQLCELQAELHKLPEELQCGVTVTEMLLDILFYKVNTAFNKDHVSHRPKVLPGYLSLLDDLPYFILCLNF